MTSNEIGYARAGGKLLLVSQIFFIAFSVILSLRIALVVKWNWWAVFSPLLAWVLVLLVLALVPPRSKRRKPVPYLLRIAWLLTLVGVILFVPLEVLRLQGNVELLTDNLALVFSPLWATSLALFYCGYAILLFSSFSSALIERCAALVKGCWKCKRRPKYVALGVCLFGLGLVAGIQLVLIFFKCLNNDQFVSWGFVFIPWWTSDVLGFCIGSCMLLFSFGAREDAIFPLHQQILFIGMCLCSSAFKVLLALYLDLAAVKIEEVMVPAYIIEFLLAFCGISTGWLARDMRPGWETNYNSFGSVNREGVEHDIRTRLLSSSDSWKHSTV